MREGGSAAVARSLPAYPPPPPPPCLPLPRPSAASGVTGTWAHGLYMATTVLLALNTSASRVSALNVFCSIKDAQLGTLFEGGGEERGGATHVRPS